MSYLDKQYLSETGFDFTQFVNTEEDAKIFEEMIEHEKQTKDIPVKDCLDHIAQAINLGRKLQGMPPAVVGLIQTPKSPSLN